MEQISVSVERMDGNTFGLRRNNTGNLVAGLHEEKNARGKLVRFHVIHFNTEEEARAAAKRSGFLVTN